LFRPVGISSPSPPSRESVAEKPKISLRVKKAAVAEWLAEGRAKRVAWGNEYRLAQTDFSIRFAH
jgi:hypothetical protein